MKFCVGYNFSVTTILCIHVNSCMILQLEFSVLMYYTVNFHFL